MRVAFLVKGLETPRTRYRILPYIPLLQREGVECRVIDIPRGPLKRWGIFGSLDRYDTVVIQKKLFNAFDFSYLRRRARRLIFDVDDAVMVKAGAASSESKRRRSRFERTVKECDFVLAGNSYLLNEVRKLKAKAVLIPTCIDLDRYPEPGLETGDQDGRLHLGWIGSQGTLPFLADLEPVFNSLSKSSLRIDLTIISNAFLENSSLPVKKKIWSMDTEVRDLMRLDVGLAPLPDNPWTRGKSATKVVQYMAAGLPVVSSPVGANAEIVMDGVTGFLADHQQEWIEKILYLGRHRHQRIQMGMQGRRRVEKYYSIQGVFPVLYKALMNPSS